ncbi:FkbM family methyltransferase [Paenibacillus sp. MCAF9]|uniref:FkbM family methyltransferase n=1 Tax=Paenibacillus sp. MCAF9 TaxID=3233046 RepID=UPI003F9CD1EA
MKKLFRNIEQEIIFEKLLKGLNINEQQIEKHQETSLDTNLFLLEIRGYINSMLQTRENYAYRYLHSHRKVIGPLIIFAKKVVRKLLKWYVEPIAFQQTKFNSAVTPAIGRMTEIVSELTLKTNKIEGSYEENQEKTMKKHEHFDNIVAQLIEKHDKEHDAVAHLVQKQKQHSDVVAQLMQRQEEQTSLIIKLTEEVRFLEKKQKVQEQLSENTRSIFEKLDEIDLFKKSNDLFFDKKTHSQSGEDSILAYIIHVLGIPVESVDYIDLGANHAKELSNTYYFYSKGAKGILVEANSNLIPELSFYRHRDIILNKCVDIETDKNIEFYILNGDGMSTPDFEAATSFCEKNPDLKIIDKKVVETISYSTIVEKYLGKAPTILSIDIEGKDMEILESIDYKEKRPLIIVTEMISYDIKLNYKTKKTDIKDFLESKGYDEYAFTGINSIFIDGRFLRERENQNEYSN